MVKTYRILKLQKVYYFTVILSIMLTNKIQESCTHLLQTNRLVVYLKFFQKLIFFKKHLIQNLKTNEVWFTDQNSRPLEIEDKINLTLVIK